MFNRIPTELRAYRQWVVWKFVVRENAKPTKVPYSPLTHAKASVTDPSSWATFDEAVAAFNAGGYDGIGFVLTRDDPYGFIDLDETYGDQTALDRQIKVFQEFNSYSELSPSGAGLHIIVKGNLPHGRKRSQIEVYSSERYMTMTGNVHHDAPIEDRHELLNLLWEQIGGKAVTVTTIEDQPQQYSDREIYDRAAAAVNGEKFLDLWGGDWVKHYPNPDGTGDQSRADFALVDIIAFYTQNRAQIVRMFRMSQLGQRDKAKRDNYVGYMLDKAFDRHLPPVDIDGLRNQWNAILADRAASAVYVAGGDTGAATAVAAPAPSIQAAPGGTAGEGFAPPMNGAMPPVSGPAAPVNAFGKYPPGLLGEIAQFIEDQAPRQIQEIALAGAIGMFAGITGRAYNVSNTGLNQYVMLLAHTGSGKEAIASGVSKLMGSILTSVPASQEFIGPGNIRSDAGLIKWLSKKPCFVSIIGEVGLRLKQMSLPTASSNEIGLKTVLLDLYHKSGQGSVLNPMAYSDTQKNTDPVVSPSLTLVGESTPERFYEALDEAMITEGLLPRFTVLEYNGARPTFNEAHGMAKPSFALVDKLATITAHCLQVMHGGHVINVQADQQAQYAFASFNTECDKAINDPAAREVHRHLWNRAHLKSMKLAALVAVGINPYYPCIDYQTAEWAIEFVRKEVRNLVNRFESGDVGSSGSSEAKQVREVIRVVREYMSSDHAKFEKYGGTFEMHRDGVILADHISRRLIASAAFRLDRFGATNALKRTIQALLDNDDIRELPKAQMQMKYGKSARAFVVSNAHRFTE